MSTRAAGRGLMAILGLYLIIGTLYAVNTPAWQVPDEPAHYNYIRHIVEQGAFPVLQAGDYDQAYLARLTSEGFPPALPIDAVRYEGHQPPLYYALAAPVFIAAGGDLVSLRLFSLFLGGGVVFFTFLLVREIKPGRPVLALAGAGFVAFVPQHLAMMAGVNNDALAELLMVLGLWLSVRLVTRPAFSAAPLALTLGAAFLAKATVYPLAVIVGVALLLKARRAGWNKRQLLTAGLRVFVPALLIGALWWGRNAAVYGGLDVLGLQRHDQIVVGQPRTSEWLADLGGAEFVRRFAVTTFQSFWGQFGWMGVVMDRRVYWALAVFSLALAAGFVGALARQLRAGGLSSAWRDPGVLLAISLLLAVALYLYYNLTFVQHQGRYLFPALSAMGLGAALGMLQWARWVLDGARLPAEGARVWAESALPLAAIALLAALDVFALYRFIIPALR